ncbi:hypothetical protein F5050DRAFT_1709861 [Lentinula boryana]|uniref:Fungal lipase-type domain-containing protein n=1 Tax=Lentinula boryana TaxID=40481 RepID=A0ABQ8QLF7_9AGAR|nr:hypothetical protein F5050DRAFT_1709861 [Lentinula boryana]
MHPLSLFFAVLSALGLTSGTLFDLHSRAVTQISASGLASFAPYTQFARAAYYPTDMLKDWPCGVENCPGSEACEANSDFEVSLVGGDGDDIQIYFVGESDLTDIDIPLATPGTALFPGISSSVEVDSGFLNEHVLTAKVILAKVKSIMSSKIGHSLGGALAETDTIFFRFNIPSASISAMTYGTPRVGNHAWAALVDASDVNFKRIDNKHGSS